MKKALYSGLAALTLAACGGGPTNPPPPPPPPPPPTLSITEATVSPSSALEGDVLSFAGTPAASDGSAANMSINYNGIVASGEGRQTGTKPATSSGNASFTASKNGSSSVTQNKPITVTPLSVQGTPSATSGDVGTSVDYAATAPQGTDSIVVRFSDGRTPQKVTGNAANINVPITAPGTFTITPTAYNVNASRTGTPVSITGNALPVLLRLMARDVEDETFGRYTVLIDGTERNLPADTTIAVTPGQHTIGIKLDQANIENLLALYQNSDMKGVVHAARTTTPLTLTQNETYEVQLIRKGKPTFSGSERESYARVYPNNQGFLRPAILENFEVYIHDGTLIMNGTEPVCGSMTPESRAAWLVAIDSMKSQDKDANGMNRRNFTVMPGNLPESKKVTRQIGGVTGIGLAPGTILVCDKDLDASGAGYYDANGFLDAWSARQSGNDWISKLLELVGFIDQNNNGAEETVNILWPRHGQSASTSNRNETQKFVYYHPTRLSIDAGKKGFGQIYLP